MKPSINFLAPVFLVLLSCPQSAAAAPLKVTTTLSSYADIAKAVGGDFVEVKYVAPPRFNPHFIEPRPSDVLKVKYADLFVHSGLDLEAWRGPLVDAAARAEIRQSGNRQLDLSTGVALLEVPDRAISRSEGDIHLYGNPHYWLDPRNGKIIAQELAVKLSELDPEHKSDYDKNLSAFTAALDSKMAQWNQLMTPFRGQELIGYHNEWVYLMNYAGLTMKQFLEPKPGIPPTPKQVEFISEYIRSHKLKGIVQASFNSNDAAESIAASTGAKVVLLSQNVGEQPESSSYIAMIDYNISKLLEALRRD